MKYGIQLYSMRDMAASDMEGALEAVSSMGYGYVEFAGFFGHPAADIRAMLEKYSLSVSGTHTGWDSLKNNFGETVRYHKDIGCDNIIIPGADLSSAEKLDGFIDFLNSVLPKLRDAGLTLGYHNHFAEFAPMEYYGRQSTVFEELFNRTQIEFELDTYWAFFANRNPLSLINTLCDAGRIRFVHLKDGEGRQGRALGEGNAPVRDVIAKAKQRGLLCVVESEGLSPSGTEEVARCMKFLKTVN